MHFLHIFIVFITLLACVRMDDIDPTPPPVKANATVSLGEPRLFSGEDVQMTCSVPDDPSPNWTYEWFYDGELLSATEVYSLNKARVLQSGSYTCKGTKTIKPWPYIVPSIPSDPLKIHIDGGWVLLRTPFEPLIIGERMTLTCRVRDDPLLLNVVFYKDEVEFKKQKGRDVVFTNLTLEDAATYSCRATWIKNMEYQSSQSLPSYVTVLDKLETPRMIIRGRSIVISGNKVEFKCLTKVNAREQDLNLEYFYLKNGNRLGPASASETYSISQVNKNHAGNYTCKVRIRALNVERWSNQVNLVVWPPVDL